MGRVHGPEDRLHEAQRTQLEISTRTRLLQKIRQALKMPSLFADQSPFRIRRLNQNKPRAKSKVPATRAQALLRRRLAQSMKRFFDFFAAPRIIKIAKADFGDPRIQFRAVKWLFCQLKRGPEPLLRFLEPNGPHANITEQFSKAKSLRKFSSFAAFSAWSKNGSFIACVISKCF